MEPFYYELIPANELGQIQGGGQVEHEAMTTEGKA